MEYRFIVVQYFAWTEIIRNEIQYIDFQGSEKSKQMSQLRDKINSLWQTDRYRDSFRICAGKQRAIGEVMIEGCENRRDCIGYTRFLKRLQNKKEP